MKKVLGAVVMVAALAGCLTTKDAENLATLGVDFSWEKTVGCTAVPPAFHITNIPNGTAFLNFSMTDLDKPGYMHGGGIVAYQGGEDIPEGAFVYVGPCPPGGSHDYRFRVEALNSAKDMVLGRGEMTKAFPPK